MKTSKEILKRFTSDKFSYNDYLSVSSWFRKEEYHEDLNLYMKEDWAETENTIDNQERLNYLLDRLHHRINLENNNQPNLFFRFYHGFSKVAAVLIIPALITIAILSYLSVNSPVKSESWAKIHSPVGARTKFQLPDGSQGWLNGGSSIKYPVNFEKKRYVEISGEAWFDVVHLESEDFRVITPWFDVKVLGTQFNVVAYEKESTAGVILEKGKVVVLGKDEEIKGELDQDQQFIFDKSTMELAKTSIDSKSYTSWKDGLLIFRNVSMAEIAKRLERRFNAEIILHGDSLKSSVFRATFTDESLEEICKLLATVAPVKYIVHKREKLPDNTFPKGKIEMWLKN